MNSIPFTQYVLPHGRKVPTSVEVAEGVYNKAVAIINAGYVFECEVLATGQVSLTITDLEEGDVAIKITPNGPAVIDAVNSLVEDFYPTISLT